MLFSGGLMLGAVFMATDMVTSPITPLGTWLYGGLIGVLVVLIRVWGGMPEGVMYAILLGNAVAPLLDRDRAAAGLRHGEAGEPPVSAPATPPAAPPVAGLADVPRHGRHRARLRPR